MIKAVMVAGEPFEVIFNFTLNGNSPLPLAAYAAKCELRNQRENGNALLSLGNDSTFFVRDNNGGQLRVKLPSFTTINLDFQKALLDVWITDGVNGVRSDPIEVTFQRGVTRA